MPELERPAEHVSNLATTVVLSKAKDLQTNVIMLDTQSAVHLVSNETIMTDITPTSSPILVQGITKETLPVTLEGYVPDIGVTSYFGPNMAANILSYHKLQ
jgi:hypothetical protein